jgi:hypothetical protein
MFTHVGAAAASAAAAAAACAAISWCCVQLEALSDRLLVSFKEASLDLGKLLATKGLAAVRGRPWFLLPVAVAGILVVVVIIMLRASDVLPAWSVVSLQLFT